MWQNILYGIMKNSFLEAQNLYELLNNIFNITHIQNGEF